MIEKMIENRMANINEFIRYCKFTKEELKKELCQELKTMYKKVKFEDGFVYAKGNIPLMLVAHMDTVHQQQCNDENIFISADLNTIKSNVGIGGDDRCGVYMVMYILKHTDFRPYILFCEDEEIGGVGSGKFVKRYNANNLDINFVIQFDRANANDSVYYDLDNLEFEDYINKFGFKTAYGSFTDICNLCPALKCAGVNLSCGYYKQHHIEEYVIFDEMEGTIVKAINLLNDFKLDDKFEWKEYTYTYSGATTYKDDVDWYKNYYKDYNYYADYPTDCNHIHEHCEYCDRDISLNDAYEDDLGYVVCKDCAKEYGLKVCKSCGYIVTSNSDGICDECKRYYKDIKDGY